MAQYDMKFDPEEKNRQALNDINTGQKYRQKDGRRNNVICRIRFAPKQKIVPEKGAVG